MAAGGATMNTLGAQAELERVTKRFGVKGGDRLGKGGTMDCTVTLGRSKDGRVVAVKEYSMAKVDSDWADQVEQAKGELLELISTLQQLQHPALATIHACTIRETPKPHVELQMEFCGKLPEEGLGTLQGVVAHKPLDAGKAKQMARQLVDGLSHLHDEGLEHGDLKGSNVLLFDNGVAKMTDYGFRKALAGVINPSDAFSSVTGVPQYVAPEVFAGASGEYDTVKADVWSLGGVVLLAVSGKPPWSEFGQSGQAVMKIMQARSPPKYPDGLPEECANFLNQCFTRDPEQRPLASDLKSHPFLA